MMLWKLLSRIDRTCFDPCVIALSSRTDTMIDLFRDIGVPCLLLGFRPSIHSIINLPQLAWALRKIRPDIIQGWLYHGNIAATVAAALLPGSRAPVLWSIRGTLISGEKTLSRLVISLGAKLSFLPKKIINNSMASAIEHEQRLGYRSRGRVVVPNGFDTDVFCPSDEARESVRKSLGLSHDTLLIGLIGRYHPMKDHDNFLRAAAIVSAKHPDVQYLLAGENVDRTNTELSALISAYGLADRVQLLGLRNDMPTVMAALDIATSSSSSGEGFPNVIGEAMSCGVPCVVTDVGDSASIVGEAGRSVTPRDPRALAAALSALIENGEQRKSLGRRARQSIIERFSLEAVVRQYETLYLQVHHQSLQSKRA